MSGWLVNDKTRNIEISFMQNKLTCDLKKLSLKDIDLNDDYYLVLKSELSTIYLRIDLGLARLKP